MNDIDEKRVYADRTDKETVFVAASIGIVAVDVSGGLVGEFGIAHRCSPRGVTALGGRIAAATESDVVAGGADGFEATAFGPAVAVGVRDGTLLAAGPDGRIAALDDGSWRDLGTLDATVAAIDGDLVAADAGVYRLDDLVHTGLREVRDVSAVGRPLAATGEGLYALGNGWMGVADGDFRAVARRADGSAAHAASTEGFFARRDGEWLPVDLPVEEPVVDVAYGRSTYAVTDTGTLLVEDDDGWRAHPIGASGVVGLA